MRFSFTNYPPGCYISSFSQLHFGSLISFLTKPNIDRVKARKEEDEYAWMFRDFAPRVFQSLRYLNNIDDEQYKVITSLHFIQSTFFVDQDMKWQREIKRILYHWDDIVDSKKKDSLNPIRTEQLLVGSLSGIEEVVSTGRSGSFFFKSRDSKYFLKTLPTSEENLLFKILPDFYQVFLCNFPLTISFKCLSNVEQIKQIY